MAPPPLDEWRAFFGGARASIFDAIDAAADHPAELRARRAAIAERLYSAGSVPGLCSSDRAAEAVTPAAPPRGDPVLAEAFRVKAALSDAEEKSEADLLDLLGRLRRLEFTVDAITATEIGMAVKPLRKHSSKQIRQLVRSLIEGWKATVNEWMSNGDPLLDQTPESGDVSCLEQEGGLPSPPMDEGALFATPCTSIRLSEFFDEMDDDGNIRTDGKEEGGQAGCTANRETVKNKKQPPTGHRHDPEQDRRLHLQQSAVRQPRVDKSSSCQQTRKQSGSIVTGSQGKPSSAAFGPGRPDTQVLSQHLELDPNGPRTGAKQQQEISAAQRSVRHKGSSSTQKDGNSIREKVELASDATKLEAAKRRLQEGYQEINNAKKQRTIRMVDPQDLPKQRTRSLKLNGGKPRSSGIRNRLGIRR